MSSGEKCEYCGGKLAYRGHVCAQCGRDSQVPKMGDSEALLHYFFFIPYLLAEFYGFSYCLDMADLMGGGDKAFFSYVYLRMALTLVTFLVFTYGRKANSSALRAQGGCLWIFNLLFLLVLFYLVTF